MQELSRRSSDTIRVGLVQINSSFSGQHYFPYSVGILQAYAMKHLPASERYKFLLPIYRRIRVADAVAELKDAEIVCFSTYVWNVRLSLAIAEALKRRNPEVLIVFGGPQVTYYFPPMVEGFLRQNRFVDVAVHGEGERPLAALLERAGSRRWEEVPSTSFLTPEGTLCQTKCAERFKDLAEVPSPYLEGIFDPLMAANPNEKWIGMWETNRGCPFACTFCGWGSAVNTKVAKWNEERLYREIEWFADHRVEFVFCADANFGILPRDIGLARHVARVKLERGFPHRLAVQDTKNVKERAFEVREALAAADLNTGVVLSLQSLDPTTLKYIRRDNISLDAFFEVQRRFAAKGIESMTDLILGLPGETYDSFANGVSLLIEKGQHNRIQFNNLSDVPDAEMSDPAYQDLHGMVAVESDIVNIHGAVEETDITERQRLIVATHYMPPEDWVRARCFAWVAGLLHFDKLLQIPLIVAHELGGVSYRELIELFAEGQLSPTSFPVLTEIQQFLITKARDIQSGGVEYCHAPEWLNIHWPADEYLFIRLAVGGELGEFYDEAGRALAAHFVLDAVVLRDALTLNRALLKMPFQSEDLIVECSTNIWGFYRAVVVGQAVPLDYAPRQYRVDRTSEQWWTWEGWFHKVVWYGNKRGAYLYGNKPVDLDLAGHF